MFQYLEQVCITRFIWTVIINQLDSLISRGKQYEVASTLFDALFENSTCRLETAKRETLYFYWTGIVEDTGDDKNVFVDEYDGSPIAFDPDLWPGPTDPSIACTIARYAAVLFLFF